jgi:hypothetical protein
MGTLVRAFPDAGFTGPPNRCQIGSEQGAVFLDRPKGGGPICILHVVSGDGREMIAPYDVRADFGGKEVDCYAADVFVSTAAPQDGGGTIKAFVNLKPPDARSGGDRWLWLVETGQVPR